MKKLGVRVGSGIGITHDWTDQELVDIFASDPSSAIEYEQVIETLKEERQRVQAELDELKSRRVKGISPALDHLMLLSRILFSGFGCLSDSTKIMKTHLKSLECPQMRSA